MDKPDIRNKIKNVKIESMSDALLKQYLDNVRIFTSNELGKYNDIDELLPRNNTYFIILYEQVPHRGHWTCVTRANDEISYFDSYGKRPDYALDDWFKSNKLQTNKNLTKLFDNTKLNVFYNDVDYQGHGSDISTCGRHAVCFIICSTKKNMDLHDYNKMMEKLKEMTKLDYDELASFFINNIHSFEQSSSPKPRLNKI